MRTTVAHGEHIIGPVRASVTLAPAAPVRRLTPDERAADVARINDEHMTEWAQAHWTED